MALTITLCDEYGIIHEAMKILPDKTYASTLFVVYPILALLLPIVLHSTVFG
jgi:hypothetical protein